MHETGAEWFQKSGFSSNGVELVGFASRNLSGFLVTSAVYFKKFGRN
jgi:hypothetical protein